MAGELQLIDRFFRTLGAARSDVSLGIGDDAALLEVPTDRQLVLSTDSLIAGVHFLPGAPARSIGHRSLAVNLSDIAAMGATPAWALLSLALPEVDEGWLGEFAAGFGELARAQGVALVGGNLSRGALHATVTIAGLVPAGAALRRSGGRPGDLLCITGTAGDAAGGRAVLRGEIDGAQAAELRQRFEFPTPRVAFAAQLHGLARACIDISDGVYADIARLAAASGVGAEVEVTQLPLSTALRTCAGETAWQYALQGGEDYELALAVPAERLAALQNLAARHALPCTAVGKLTPQPGMRLLRDGAVMQFSPASFDHFAR